MAIVQNLKQSRGGKIGSIVAMSAIPSDKTNAYILCDGRSLNTFTYKRLHKTIGNTYGGTAYTANVTDLPSATTTFNVPDLRGRVIKGSVSMNNTANIAQYTGSDTMSMDPYTLQSTDVPSHQHNVDGGTNYAYSINEAAINAVPNVQVSSYRIARTSNFQPDANSANQNVNATAGHSHDDASAIQPSLVLNYYIQAF